MRCGGFGATQRGMRFVVVPWLASLPAGDFCRCGASKSLGIRKELLPLSFERTCVRRTRFRWLGKRIVTSDGSVAYPQILKTRNDMANLRNLKKEIDCRLEEVVFDCDMAICFQPSKEQEIFGVMQEAVAVRNALYSKAMNPAEPRNRSLVRKHYAALRAEMEVAFGELFAKLSRINEVK